MPEKRKFVCIVCPRGCPLEVELDAASSSALSVRGNTCKRGDEYARREVVDPRRSLTSTVRVEGFPRRRLPVKTSGAIPLKRLLEAARGLDSLVVDSPVACGEVVLPNFMGMGVDILATDTLERS